jgi:hypothetical protein
MFLPESVRSRAKVFVAASFVALPAVIFYSILLRHLSPLPYLDDYGLLHFLNEISELRGAAAKGLCFLAAQHNEYKIFFENAVAWLQLQSFGHVDFRVLSAIGDGFVLLLGVLLWKMFLPGHKDLGARLTYFIPIAWLLFQLEYCETLNWATALQNVAVPFFALANHLFSAAAIAARLSLRAGLLGARHRGLRQRIIPRPHRHAGAHPRSKLCAPHRLDRRVCGLRGRLCLSL